MKRFRLKTVLHSSAMLWMIIVDAFDNEHAHRSLMEASLKASVIWEHTKYMADIVGEEYYKGNTIVVNSKNYPYWFQQGAGFEDKLEDNEKSCQEARRFCSEI